MICVKCGNDTDVSLEIGDGIFECPACYTKFINRAKEVNQAALEKAAQRTQKKKIKNKKGK